MTATAERATYTIGEIAQRSGLSAHTIRWYESQGLFPRDIERTAAGQRRYDDDVIEWLVLLTRLRDSGMPVAGMARYSALVRQGPGNEAERIALMRSHAQELAERIAELERSNASIRAKIACYEQALEDRGVNPSAEP